MLDDIAEKFYGVQRKNPMGMFGDIFKVEHSRLLIFVVATLTWIHNLIDNQLVVLKLQFI